MYITANYEILFNFEISLGKREKMCEEQTDRVTLSLLEQIIAAKKLMWVCVWKIGCFDYVFHKSHEH